MNLTVTNGRFAYGHSGPTVFENVNFSLDSGDILAILGPNGAGKTTLLRCVTGMLRWAGGDSRLDGESIRTFIKAQFCRIFFRRLTVSFKKVYGDWYCDIKGWPEKFFPNSLMVGDASMLIQLMSGGED